MSDFLISLGKEYSGQDLLRLVKTPYGEVAPEGQCFDLPWGSIAVLEDHFTDKNIIIQNGIVLAWVGDLVTDMSDSYVNALIRRLAGLRQNKVRSLNSDEALKQLNGAFAIFVADKQGISIVTDPGNFVPVYIGIEDTGRPVSFGTHSDLVCVITNNSPQIDVVSAGEFLNCGSPSFPNTMYENVKELNPGRLYSVDFEESTPRVRSTIYWTPPAEMHDGYDVNELADNLRETFLHAVRDRCPNGKVGIELSGGQDSRLIMAAIPESVKCIGLTFCDYLNRETHTAAKVSRSYNRNWIALYRDAECLGNSIIQAVRATGCEAEWIVAHALTLTEDISKLGLSTILGGMEMDVYLKGWFAHDWVCKKRMKGLLPDKHVKVPYEHLNNISGFEKGIHTEKVTSDMYLRRQRAYNENSDLGRSSIADWLIRYPFTLDTMTYIASTVTRQPGAEQSESGTKTYNFTLATPQKPSDVHRMKSINGWSTERRFLPIRLAALDRRMLEFSYKCPLELKLGGEIFLRAAMKIYGPGAKIPSANDGVRPGSGHFWRLIQRAIRKLQNGTTAILEKLGREPKIQHSWHNYQKYWRESKKLNELREQYGSNLDKLDGVLFKESGRALLQNKDIDWRYGFCLIQLAMWLGVIGKYRDILRKNKLREISRI